MKFDLHVHSSYSADSFSSITDIIEKAKKANLQGISIVDHNDFRGSLDAMKFNSKDFLVIPGAEYSTDRGHFLVYFLKEGLESKNLSRNTAGCFHWQDIITKAHEQDALVFWAHPNKFKSVCDQLVLDSIDGIEIFNSRAALSRNRYANLHAYRFAVKNSKAFSAGSDAHWLNEIGHAFWECDLKEADCETDQTARIKDALKTGKGKVWGLSSSYLYPPSSHILKSFSSHSYGKAIFQSIKLCYSGILEIGHILGIRRKIPGGWLEIKKGEGE